MENVLMILLALSLLGVLGVLFTGLIIFVRGGKINQKYGNRLMQLRVISQAIAIFIVILLVTVRVASD